jgi:ribosomal-protein-alanine acetyltransferase
MTYRLTPASPEDLPELIAWEATLFGSDAWSTELMAEEIAHPGRYYLVARAGGVADIVGYAGVATDPRPGGDGDIQTIAVVPEHRGRGLGRHLVRALIERAQDQGVARVFLEVRADNDPAISLYLSEGFAEIDRRAAYYQPDGVDALVMMKELQPQTSGWAVGRE